MHWSASFCLKIITTVITDISYLTGHGFELTACLPLSLLTTSYSQVVERDFHHVKTVVNWSIVGNSIIIFFLNPSLSRPTFTFTSF